MPPPASIQNTASKITLKSYVLLLERISNGEVASIHDLKGIENRVGRELLRAGLVSDDDSINHLEQRLYGNTYLAITPEGIASLDSWSRQLKEQSFLYKAGEALERLLWLIVGSAIVWITKLL